MQFGPFQAAHAPLLSPNVKFPLKIFAKTDEDSYYLDTSDEELCNWMCLVAPVTSSMNQNLICYQMNQDIYYSVMKDIQPGEELRVWYAPYYAVKMGSMPFSVDFASPDPLEQDPELTTDLDSVEQPEASELDLVDEAKEKGKRKAKRKRKYNKTRSGKNSSSQTMLVDQQVTQRVAEQLPACQLGARDVPDKWRCRECGAEETSVIAYARHLMAHFRPIAGSTDKPSRCHICRKKFSSEMLLVKHKVIKHNVVVKRPRLLANVGEVEGDSPSSSDESSDGGEEEELLPIPSEVDTNSKVFVLDLRSVDVQQKEPPLPDFLDDAASRDATCSSTVGTTERGAQSAVSAPVPQGSQGGKNTSIPDDTVTSSTTLIEENVQSPVTASVDWYTERASLPNANGKIKVGQEIPVSMTNLQAASCTADSAGDLLPVDQSVPVSSSSEVDWCSTLASTVLGNNLVSECQQVPVSPPTMQMTSGTTNILSDHVSNSMPDISLTGENSQIPPASNTTTQVTWCTAKTRVPDEHMLDILRAAEGSQTQSSSPAAQVPWCANKTLVPDDTMNLSASDILLSGNGASPIQMDWSTDDSIIPDGGSVTNGISDISLPGEILQTTASVSSSAVLQQMGWCMGPNLPIISVANSTAGTTLTGSRQTETICTSVLPQMDWYASKGNISEPVISTPLPRVSWLTDETQSTTDGTPEQSTICPTWCTDKSVEPMNRIVNRTADISLLQTQDVLMPSPLSTQMDWCTDNKTVIPQGNISISTNISPIVSTTPALQVGWPSSEATIPDGGANHGINTPVPLSIPSQMDWHTEISQGSTGVTRDKCLQVPSASESSLSQMDWQTEENTLPDGCITPERHNPASLSLPLELAWCTEKTDPIPESFEGSGIQKDNSEQDEDSLMNFVLPNLVDECRTTVTTQAPPTLIVEDVSDDETTGPITSVAATTVTNLDLVNIQDQVAQLRDGEELVFVTNAGQVLLNTAVDRDGQKVAIDALLDQLQQSPDRHSDDPNTPPSLLKDEFHPVNNKGLGGIVNPQLNENSLQISDDAGQYIMIPVADESNVKSLLNSAQTIGVVVSEKDNSVEPKASADDVSAEKTILSQQVFTRLAGDNDMEDVKSLLSKGYSLQFLVEQEDGSTTLVDVMPSSDNANAQSELKPQSPVTASSENNSQMLINFDLNNITNDIPGQTDVNNMAQGTEAKFDMSALQIVPGMCSNTVVEQDYTLGLGWMDSSGHLPNTVVEDSLGDQAMRLCERLSSNNSINQNNLNFGLTTVQSDKTTLEGDMNFVSLTQNNKYVPLSLDFKKIEDQSDNTSYIADESGIGLVKSIAAQCGVRKQGFSANNLTSSVSEKANRQDVHYNPLQVASSENTNINSSNNRSPTHDLGQLIEQCNASLPDDSTLSFNFGEDGDLVHTSALQESSIQEGRFTTDKTDGHQKHFDGLIMKQDVNRDILQVKDFTDLVAVEAEDKGFEPLTPPEPTVDKSFTNNNNNNSNNKNTTMQLNLCNPSQLQLDRLIIATTTSAEQQRATEPTVEMLSTPVPTEASTPEVERPPEIALVTDKVQQQDTRVTDTEQDLPVEDCKECVVRVDAGPPYNCDICSKEFLKAIYLYRHLRKHTGEFTCVSCLAVFARKESLLSHACFAGQGAITCAYCEKSFKHKKLLTRHMAIHTGKWTCQQCKRVFASRYLLEVHQQNHHEVTAAALVQCAQCGLEFLSANAKRRHRCCRRKKCRHCGHMLRLLTPEAARAHERYCYEARVLAQGRQAICPDCGSKFSRAVQYRLHVFKHTHPLSCTQCHRSFRTEKDKTGHKCHDKWEQCLVCLIYFSSVRQLERHGLSHGEPAFHCFECGLSFHEEENLTSHACQEVGPYAPSSAAQRNWKPKAPGTLVGGKRMKKGGGEENDNGNKPLLVCDVCGEVYKTPYSLRAHMFLHGERRFECPVCLKKFHRKDVLQEHLYVHQKPQVPCPMCNKKLKSKKSLDVHMLRHTGKKNYSCNICGKEFFQKVNLHKHERAHNPKPNTPLACPHCPKTFISQDYRSKHILEHTQGCIYQCSQCDKAFVKDYLLNSHVRVQHNGRTFPCPVCPHVLKYRNSLLRHMENLHPEYRGSLSDQPDSTAPAPASTEPDSSQGAEVLLTVSELQLTTEGVQQLQSSEVYDPTVPVENAYILMDGTIVHQQESSLEDMVLYVLEPKEEDRPVG